MSDASQHPAGFIDRIDHLKPPRVAITSTPVTGVPEGYDGHSHIIVGETKEDVQGQIDKLMQQVDRVGGGAEFGHPLYITEGPHRDKWFASGLTAVARTAVVQ